MAGLAGRRKNSARSSSNRGISARIMARWDREGDSPWSITLTIS